MSETTYEKAYIFLMKFKLHSHCDKLTHLFSDQERVQFMPLSGVYYKINFMLECKKKT